MTTKSEKSMIYSVVVMWLALHVHLVTGQSLVFAVPSIQSIDICNKSAVTVSWQYDPMETEPYFVILKIQLRNLNKGTGASMVRFQLGAGRLNFTSYTFVNDRFFFPDQYYTAHLEYTANYSTPSSLGPVFTGMGSHRLFKMENTSIPNEEIETNVTDSSITVLLMWPKEIPYYSLQTNVMLANRNTTLPVEKVPDENYMISKFRFENLSPQTEYELCSIFQVHYAYGDEFVVPRERKWTVRTGASTTTTRPTSGAEKLVSVNTVPLCLLNILVFYVLPSYHIL